MATLNTKDEHSLTKKSLLDPALPAIGILLLIGGTSFIGFFLNMYFAVSGS
ncbi:MAG: hypothetical protein OQK35_03575 [Alphaproteobacteria bacterium]|nr:hypothetical protein [Rhodospirillales bacterium]MCW9045392.1 hypothetical protein [Alphaproteobacteria bacterium]